MTPRPAPSSSTAAPSASSLSTPCAATSASFPRRHFFSATPSAKTLPTGYRMKFRRKTASPHSTTSKQPPRPPTSPKTSKVSPTATTPPSANAASRSPEARSSAPPSPVPFCAALVSSSSTTLFPASTPTLKTKSSTTSAKSCADAPPSSSPTAFPPSATPTRSPSSTRDASWNSVPTTNSSLATVITPTSITSNYWKRNWPKSSSWGASLAPYCCETGSDCDHLKSTNNPSPYNPAR